MTALYDLLVLGAPEAGQLQELRSRIDTVVQLSGMSLGTEVTWTVQPDVLHLSPRRSTAAVYFGGVDADDRHLDKLIRAAVPVLPVVTELSKVGTEIPDILRPLNCLSLEAGMQRVSTALLECAGLLPRQRNVFLSYRRNEARAAALQLYDALSARQFEVFLDTHDVAPAVDFQAALWHRLCDSDVLVMLDTPSYFDSRWTAAEFGRALAKGIAVLRVGWPDATPSIRTQTASRVELIESEVDTVSGQLAPAAIQRICMQVEAVRSESHAVRMINLVGQLRHAVESVGGRVAAVGSHRAVHLELPDRRTVTVYPALGVPTSQTLHDAASAAEHGSVSGSVAVVYDAVGLSRDWLGHMDWLGTHIHAARWLKSHEAAWALADWMA